MADMNRLDELGAKVVTLSKLSVETSEKYIQALGIAVRLYESSQRDLDYLKTEVLNNHPLKSWTFWRRLKWLLFGGTNA